MWRSFLFHRKQAFFNISFNTFINFLFFLSLQEYKFPLYWAQWYPRKKRKTCTHRICNILCTIRPKKQSYWRRLKRTIRVWAVSWTISTSLWSSGELKKTPKRKLNLGWREDGDCCYFWNVFIVVWIVNILLNNDDMKTTHSALLLAWSGSLCKTDKNNKQP